MQHPKCCTKNLTVFKFDSTSCNVLQHIATYRNRVAKRTQHVVPNNVARCCVEMLRAFGQALTFAQVVVKTETVVISCCCFADNGTDFNSARAARTLNSVLECVLNVQHAYFSSFIQSNSSFVVLSLMSSMINTLSFFSVIERLKLFAPLLA